MLTLHYSNFDLGLFANPGPESPGE